MTGGTRGPKVPRQLPFPRSKARPSRRDGPGGSALPFGTRGGSHPRLGLGAWASGRWGPEDEARTKATLGRAFERGIRWFDTAEVYGAGRSERILGEVLHRAGAVAPPCLVASKVSWEHLRPGQVHAALQGTLERLGRRSVDLYLVHAPNPHVPIAETLRALEAVRKEGKVGAIGVSNFSPEELAQAREALPGAELTVNQIRWSLLEPDEGEAVLGYCRKAGILVEAYSPLARGLLCGRYLDGETPRGSGAEGPLGRERFPELRTRALAVRTVAHEAGVSLPAVALHWLARKGVAPVFGASRPEQVDQVLEAWETPVPDAVLDRAEAAVRAHAA